MKLKPTVFLAALTAFTFSFATVSCERDTPAEDAGEEIDDAMDDARDGMEDLGDDIEDATDDL